MTVWKVVIYSILLVINIVPTTEILELLSVYILIGFIFADCKNQNIRSLMLVMSLAMFVTFQISDGVLYLLEQIVWEKTYIADALYNISILMGLWIMRLCVLYRSELNNTIRKALHIKTESYQRVLADTLMLRFLSLYIGVNAILAMITSFYGYKKFNLAEQGLISESESIEEIYINFASTHWVVMGIGMICIYVIMIMSTSSKNQRADLRFS